MGDELDRLDELREELDVELQGYERAREALRPVSGTDASGTVTVQLDSEGQLTSVLVGEAWRRLMSPDELPSAVLGAYHACVELRTERYLTTVAEPAPTPVRPRPADRRQVEVSGEVADRLRTAEVPQAALQGLSDLLDDILASTDAAFAMVDERLSTSVTGRSSSRHVTVELSGGGDLLSVTYDERWLATAHSFNVGRETTEAVHDAVARQSDRSASAVMDDSGLAALQQLASDPLALVRRLGIDAT